MIKNIFSLILFFSISFGQSFKFSCYKLTNFKTPESAHIYQNRYIFISNVNGNPIAKDKNGFISLFDLYTNKFYFQVYTSLNGPKGITSLGDYLFVTDIDSVKVYSISKKILIKNIEIKEAKFLNDITVDPYTKIVYISDTQKDTIYYFSLKDFQVHTLIKYKGLSPNGLFISSPYLFIASWKEGTIYILNLKNLILRPLFPKYTFSNLDGITLKNNILYFSDWNIRENINNGKLYAFDLRNKKLTLIFDHLKGPADIDYSGKVLTIPEFLNNDVLICFEK